MRYEKGGENLTFRQNPGLSSSSKGDPVDTMRRNDICPHVHTLSKTQFRKMVRRKFLGEVKGRVMVRERRAMYTIQQGRMGESCEGYWRRCISEDSTSLSLPLTHSAPFLPS
eukprot:742291-Amorphochlora_amoeboformis.AAC.2